MKNVIIITGATSGFGLAMAEKFGKAGAKLVLVARNAEKLKDVASSVCNSGGTAVAVADDVTIDGAFDKIVDTAIEQFGRIDVLINNAGGGVKIAPIEAMDNDSVHNCMELNLLSVVRGCRAVTPLMKKQGKGLIINLTSACAKYAWPEWSVYSAAKAGLSMFSRCLYTELRPFGIGVSVIVPGGANTGFAQSAGIGSFGWNEENALRPEHIADAAYSIVNQAKGAVTPEMIVFGMEQEIVPF